MQAFKTRLLLTGGKISTFLPLLAAIGLVAGQFLPTGRITSYLASPLDLDSPQPAQVAELRVPTQSYSLVDGDGGIYAFWDAGRSQLDVSLGLGVLTVRGIEAEGPAALSAISSAHA